MSKNVINILLLGLFISASVVIYHLQKPTLTPVYHVDLPIDREAADPSLVPFLAQESGLYGYQAPTGQIIISPRFSSALEFNKYGIADV